MGVSEVITIPEKPKELIPIDDTLKSVCTKLLEETNNQFIYNLGFRFSEIYLVIGNQVALQTEINNEFVRDASLSSLVASVKVSFGIE